MNWIHKILAILIIPVLVMSFTGVEIHLHLCKENGKIYSNLLLVDISHVQNDHKCCRDADPLPKNCCGTNCAAEHEADKSCCVDIQQEIVTDDTFKTSGFSFKVMIAEIEVQGFQLSNSLYHNHILSKANWTSDISNSTPLQTRTVLIL